MILKDTKFSVKTKDIYISFGYENMEKQSIYVRKKCCQQKNFDLLFIGGEGKRHYILIKDLNTCTIILYIAEEDIFPAIVCKLSLQKKYWNVALKTASKLIANKGF